MRQNNEITASDLKVIARVNLWINLGKFDIEIQKTQFDCLIRILNHISNYQRFQFNYYETRKFRAFKPKYKILDNVNNYNVDSNADSNVDSKVKNKGALLWFQYAIKMVIRKLKFSRGQFSVWDLPLLLMESHRGNLEKLFYKYTKKPESLTPEENEIFREIIETVEIQNLFIWIKPVIQELYKETKKEENKKANTGFFSKFIGKKINDEDLLSKEEEGKIEEILELSVKEATSQVINADFETKVQVDFILNEGSFRFLKTYAKDNTSSTEGFAFKYKDLLFSMRKGEYFFELDSELKDFNIEMFTLINKNVILVPITFKTFQEEIRKNDLVKMETTNIPVRNSVIAIDSEEEFVWKLNFRKNAPNDEINSKLFLQVNTLNFIYHQILLERILDFFIVDLSEDLANQAWDKLAEIKETTQESIKDAMTKKNIIEMKIEPRKVIVPINKYDLKNSRMLILEIGKMSMYNAPGNELYLEKYNLDVSTVTLSHFNSFNEMRLNKDRFDLITDTSLKLSFALLSQNFSPHQYPNFKLLLDVDNITVNVTEYLYTLLMYIIDIFRPTQEVDLWSQLNNNKNEIKKNCKVFGKVLKKNQLYRNWEEYYAVLSGGYIYFYQSVEDEDHSGYYYIKDSELIYNVSEDPLQLILQNKHGMIEIKFQNEAKHKNWVTVLIERINEMKSSFDIKTEEIIKKEEKRNYDVNLIYFGMEINVKVATAFLYNEKGFEKSFTLQLLDFKMLLNLTDLDVYINMSLTSLKVLDNLAKTKDFYQILDSTDPDNKDLKLVSLEIIVVDERSPKYKDIQIEINLQVGYLYAIWHPKVIRRLLAYLAHNDVLRNKVLREILLPIEKQLQENFIQPVKESTIGRIICSESKYTYIKLNTQLKKVRVVWIQPVLNFMYIEVSFADASLDLDMKVDHFVLTGRLGNTQIFDLSNYPFTIRDQRDFDSKKIKEILGAKENLSSLITFEYKSMNTWCPHCEGNCTSEALVNINSITLLYVQEHFLRFFNYLFSEFLGSLGPSEEVQKFRDEKNQIKVKTDPKEIDFMKLNVVLNNPQAILKPRWHFKEYLLVDFGKVTITCEYDKTFGKIRSTPEEWRWMVTYHFDIKNFIISTQDNFYLCDPTNGLINMHFTYLTEEDKLMSDLDFDKSFQIDLFFNNLNVNLRQMDYINIMRCSDLNILYTDEQYNDYNYENIYKTDNNSNNNDNNKSIAAEAEVTATDITNPAITNEAPPSTKPDPLLDTFIYMFTVLIIPKISLKLFLNEQPFTELSLYDLQLNFVKKLNDKKVINICVTSMEIFHIISQDQKEVILSDFINQHDSESEEYNQMQMMKTKRRRKATVINTNEVDMMSPFSRKVYEEMKVCKVQVERIKSTKVKQLDLKIEIDSEREKNYLIALNGLKLLIGYSTISLIKQFFMEGFPYYDNDDSDLPNLYDPNEENNPGMRVYLEIKNHLICLLSEDISSQDQDLVCLSSEIVVGYKKEKISKIKTELFNNYTELTNLKLFSEDEAQKEALNNAIINDKSDIYSMTVSLFEVSPFITNMKDVLFTEQLVIPKRKIMDNFMLNYEAKTFLQYIPPNNYVMSSDSKLDLNKMNIKASYRDIVMFLKSVEHHSRQMNVSYEEKWNSLMNFTKRKMECEEMRKNGNVSNSNSNSYAETLRKNTNSNVVKKVDKSVGGINTSINSSNGSSMRIPFTVHKIPEVDEDADEDPVDYNEDPQDVDELIVNKNSHIQRVSIIPKESSFQKFKPKDILVDKGMGRTNIVSQGLQLILIDDHANTFYPFLSVVIQELFVNTENLNFNQSIMNAGVILKVLVYNYIAGVWEPLVEKTQINMEVTEDKSDEKVHMKTINIHIPIPINKPHLALNLNISDMTISFLYLSLKSWIDKYFKLKNNYNEEIKKLDDCEKTMNITNHTVFNYTGRPLKLYRIYKNNRHTFSENYKKLSEVSENQSYEIEYFDDNKEFDFNADLAQNLIKENYICFELNDVKVFDNILKIDNMQSKAHAVDYGNLRNKLNLQTSDKDKEKFDFIVTEIKFNNLRKFIYFYSPLSFKNKTQHSLIVTLIKKGLSNFFMFLEPKKTIGVPIEYMDGEVQFIFEDSEPKVFAVKKFLSNKNIQEDLIFKKHCFTLIHTSPEKRNKVISINNSYCIRNCLPFDLQVVVMKTKEVFAISRGGRLYTDVLSIHDNLTLSLFFLHFRTLKEVNLYNTKEKERKSLSVSFQVVDEKGFPLTLYATLIKGDTKTVVIHTKGVIINNTLLDVKFYYGKDTKKAIEVAGQEGIANVFLISDERFMIVECNGFLSEPFNTTALGVSTVIECRKKNEKEKKIEFVMDCNLSLLAQDLDIYSNIITLSPRFILYNQMNFPVLVSLNSDRKNSDVYRSYEKKAFYFFDKGPESLISIRLMEIEENNSNTSITNANKSEGKRPQMQSGSKWYWSEPISLLSDSLLTIQVNAVNGYEKKYINLEKKIEGTSTFVLITETSYENCQFYIENFSSNVSCEIWQQNYERNANFVDVRSKSIFAWSNYRERNILCIRFFIGALNSRPLSVSQGSDNNDARKYEIDFETVNFILEKEKKTIQKVYPAEDMIYLRTSMYSGFAIKAIINTDGMRKSIRFTDITNEVSKITNELTKLVEFNLRIEKLGISLIGDNKNLEAKKEKYRRFEAVYITFKEILFYSKQQIVGEEVKSDMQLKIIDVEIDNQYSYISHFPIILRPLNSGKFIKSKEDQTHLPPFFNCAVFMNKKKNEETTKILLFNYLLQSFYFQIDSNVVVALINFFQNLTKEMKTNLTYINPVFVDNKINLENGIFIKENYFDPMWLQKTIVKQESKFFIQSLETSSIEIIFSFITQNKDKVFQKLLQSNPFISTFLSTISNVENVPIILNGSIMNNIYGNPNEILSNVLYIYQQSVMVQMIRIFGAIEILGNPLNLLHSLGTGVKDFFQKPIKGIVKGPLEGAKGMLDGSLSLVKHTFDGTFTTTSKITSGLSKGILYFTQDDEYINEREKRKITEKPKNFVEGIGYGLSSMAGGIFYGFTDIVVKPIQGAKKENWAGFGKGIMKGLAGVVVKPISGILELVSKTTEGIKNTVNDDDKFKTERLSRPFYGKFKFIKSYNAYHAQVIEILNNRIDHFKTHTVDFYSSEIYKNQKEDNILIVFSTTSMHIIDVSRRELKSILHYSEIKDILLESNDKIRIYFKREINGKTNSSISFSKNNSSATLMYNRIKDAMDNNYEESNKFLD